MSAWIGPAIGAIGGLLGGRRGKAAANAQKDLMDEATINLRNQRNLYNMVGMPMYATLLGNTLQQTLGFNPQGADQRVIAHFADMLSQGNPAKRSEVMPQAQALAALSQQMGLSGLYTNSGLPNGLPQAPVYGGQQPVAPQPVTAQQTGVSGPQAAAPASRPSYLEMAKQGAAQKTAQRTAQEWLQRRSLASSRSVVQQQPAQSPTQALAAPVQQPAPQQVYQPVQQAQTLVQSSVVALPVQQAPVQQPPVQQVQAPVQQPQVVLPIQSQPVVQTPVAAAQAPAQAAPALPIQQAISASAAQVPQALPVVQPVTVPSAVRTTPQPQPVVQQPIAPAPVAPAPVAPAPVAPAPVVLAPVAPAPVTPQPVTQQPVASQPVTLQPAAPAPAAAQPEAAQPVVTQPVAPQPAAPQPVTPQPAASAPAEQQAYTPQTPSALFSQILNPERMRQIEDAFIARRNEAIDLERQRALDSAAAMSGALGREASGGVFGRIMGAAAMDRANARAQAPDYAIDYAGRLAGLGSAQAQAASDMAYAGSSITGSQLQQAQDLAKLPYAAGEGGVYGTGLDAMRLSNLYAQGQSMNNIIGLPDELNAQLTQLRSIPWNDAQGRISGLLAQMAPILGLPNDQVAQLTQLAYQYGQMAAQQYGQKTGTQQALGLISGYLTEQAKNRKNNSSNQQPVINVNTAPGVPTGPTPSFPFWSSSR